MEKPKLSFWQIWNMSFGFFGIQFGFALQNANVSRIFETLGADIDKIPILWIAAPVTGLIVQPIIGHLSDKTWTRLGRRRPYFLVGAILSSIALIIMPNSPSLWIAAGMLWILDASINISMEPFRAFVGDNLPGQQRTLGFAMQSFFIGLGAVIASALPYMLNNAFQISNGLEDGQIPFNVKLSFYIGSFVFFFAVLWTVLFSKEYSPEELKKFSSQNTDSYEKQFLLEDKKFKIYGLGWLSIGLIISIFMFYVLRIQDYGLYVLFVGSILFGLFQFLLGTILKNLNGPKEVVSNIYFMPKTMKQLAFVQFFTWFALFSMWIYSTPAVAYYHFNALDPHSELFNKGADWVGVLMSVYNGFAAIAAFFIIFLSKYIFSRKYIHAICLTIGGLSLASFYIIKDPNLLIIPELGIGLAWASILSMPYAILAGALPFNKMGVYMGIFNFFIVIPQITAASILGFITKNLFNNQAIYALTLGGFSMFLAAVMMLFVKEVDQK